MKTKQLSAVRARDWAVARNVFLIVVCGALLIAAGQVASARAMTLEECVALALENNPDIRKQQVNMELALEGVSEQKALNFGKLDVIAGYTRYNLPRTLAPLTPGSIFGDPAGVPTTEDLFAAGVVYEVTLFTGFARTRAVEISALEKEMAGAAYKLSREQLIYNVRALYVNILSLQAQERAQHTYVEALERLAADVAREVRLGSKARVDQLKAETDLANGRSRLTQLVGNIAILKSSLATLLNVDPLPELEDIAPRTGELVPLDTDYQDRLGNLERLRAARLAVEKNAKAAEKSEGALYPRVVFNSSYGQNFGPNDDSNLNSGDWEKQEVWQAGLNLRWSIFDFGSTRSRVRKARLLEQQSRYELRKTELELKRSLQEAVTKVNLAVADYDSARQELAMTRETESVEQVRYDKGAADINDLLYAKARHQLARSRFVSAGYNYHAARFYLEYLLEQGENR